MGVTLDRSLTYRAHIKKTAAKMSTRANIAQKLAGTSWGANTKVLRTSALSLVYSPAEYCAPVLTSTHVKEIEVRLKKVMRTISGTLMATPTPWLPVLCNIPPPSIRRKVALSKEYSKILANLNLPMHEDCPLPAVDSNSVVHPCGWLLNSVLMIFLQAQSGRPAGGGLIE